MLQSTGSQSVGYDLATEQQQQLLHISNLFISPHAKLLQSYPTLCGPVDYSLPGFSVHGILQARILECVAMPSYKDLPHPGMEPTSLTSLHWQAGSLPLVPTGKHRSLYHSFSYLFINQSSIYPSPFIHLPIPPFLYMNS